MASVRDVGGTDDATRRRLALRVTLVIGVCGAGYHYTLTSLLDGIGPRSPAAWLAALPAAATLVAIVNWRPPDDEPDIHDRYLDYIVGLPLVLAALAVLVVLPVGLAAFFWFWRLDLVSLPLFAAGAIALCFGSRALWRQRFTVALVALAWPARYAQVDGCARTVVLLVLCAVGALAAPQALRPLVRSRGGRAPSP